MSAPAAKRSPWRRSRVSNAEVLATALKAIREAREDVTGQIAAAREETKALRGEVRGLAGVVDELAKAATALLAARPGQAAAQESASPVSGDASTTTAATSPKPGKERR